MLGFRDKKKDADEDEPEESSRKIISKHKKPIRDLKPENRKKRVAPKKPWGKSERYFVLTVFGATALGSAFLAVSARSWKLPNMPRVTFPEGVLEETYVLEGTPKPEIDTTLTETRMQAITKSLSGVYGVYVYDLNAGYAYGQEEDEVFEAASLIKLPVMAMMYSEAENGNLNLNRVYTLKDSDKIGGSGSLYYEPAGTELSLRDLVWKMGHESDNTAFNIARNMLGDSEIEVYMKNIGMTHTSLKNNETTPRDMGIFFKKLWEMKLVEEGGRDEILNSLTGTIYENWLPSGLPDSLVVAHKFGREVNVVNDAGIVFANNPYIIVVLSKGVIYKEADSALPEISRIVFQLQEGY